MKKHYFINLTNGIEYIPILNNDMNIHFTRIRSTYLERNNYFHLLTKLDSTFLLNLAIGNECYFIDYGTNRVNSKTIYYGIPLIEYILNRLWLDIEIEQYQYTKSSFDKLIIKDNKYKNIYDELFIKNMNCDKGLLLKEFSYYKNFLNTDLIRIYPIANSTIHDGQFRFYKQILLNSNV